MRKFLFLAALGLAGCGSVGEQNTTLTMEASAIQARFPTSPEESVTPGSTCSKPSERRYKERIPYCRRKVATSLKYQVIAAYDRDFGYAVGRMNRRDFKIDHYIPLCMGGSNERDNLWPQHKSIYVVTDLLEDKLCRVLAKGERNQAWAIEKIREVKRDLSRAADIQREVERLLY